ncbi:MAG: hypothetical protein ISN64_03285 [Rickettsia sp.]|nr:hypothetical protein [Rickettsia sp.]
MDFASNVQDVINGTVKDVTLDVDYAKKFLFAGELSLGASYSFGPVSTFAAVTASFRQGADEMEVSAVKNQNLQNSASKIQKGSKTRMNMPNAYELGWKLGLDVSF